MPTGLMLIGNKQDLDELNEREVPMETGETFSKVRLDVFGLCLLFIVYLYVYRYMGLSLWRPVQRQDSMLGTV